MTTDGVSIGNVLIPITTVLKHARSMYKDTWTLIVIDKRAQNKYNHAKQTPCEKTPQRL